MQLSLRDWATPLVAGAFLLSGVTGVLIFFHLDSGLNKEAHEWLGWVLLIGAAAHIVSNFTAFKKRLMQPLTKVIIGLFATILILSFIPASGEGGGKAGMRKAVDALADAPLSLVAQVAHKDVAVILADMKAAGIEIQSQEQSIKALSAGDMEKQMQIMGIIFKK
ncbi:MAG: DUF4405 domain-containing protein [Pseudobdellovibrionaceae bacterium]